MSCGRPHDTPCSEVLDRIYEYIDGELDRDRVHVIKEHLDECGPCLKEYGLEEVVKALVKRSCCETAPNELRDRVLEKIELARKELRES